MLRDENDTLWFFPGEDQLEIEKEKLIEIINEMEKLPSIKTQKYIGSGCDLEEGLKWLEFGVQKPNKWVDEPENPSSWGYEVENQADKLCDALLNTLRKKFKGENVAISTIRVSYPHSDPRSIPWEVYDKLASAVVYELHREDMPILRDFLHTPPGKELEAWEKWEAYWKEREEEEK